MEITKKQEEILFEHIDNLYQDFLCFDGSDFENCRDSLINRTLDCLTVLYDIRQKRKMEIKNG